MNDKTAIKTGITLAVIAAICTALVAATYQLTEERIAANEKALQCWSMNQCLRRW